MGLKESSIKKSSRSGEGMKVLVDDIVGRQVSVFNEDSIDFF